MRERERVKGKVKGRLTAWLTAVFLPPPKLKFATEPLGQSRVLESLVTKLMPAMTPEKVP